MLKRKNSINKENENTPSSAASSIKSQKKHDTSTRKKKSILLENLAATNLETKSPTSCSPNTSCIEHETDDDWLPVKSLKKILKQQSYAADDMISGVTDELPSHLGLHIEKVGLISFPLNEYQALDLIKASESLFMNKNEHSYVYKTSQFEFKNPEFNRQLGILAKQTGVKLGCSNEKVGIALEQMILCEKGARLPKSTHSFNNRKNSFARLVIQLPTVHTGGDYIVYSDCDEKTKKADLGQRTKKASYAMHFVAHMIESSFEVTEVKSGYCLFLVYTLWSDGEKFSRLMKQSEACQSLAANFKSIAKFERPIAILLENQYTNKALEGHPTEKVLKGVDKDRYKTLQNANMQLSETDQMCFYIIRADLQYQENRWNPYSLKIKAKELKKKKAPFTREEEEELGDEMDNEDGIMVRKSITAHGWYDANGKPLFKICSWMPVGESRVSLEFFSKLVDLSNESNEDEKVQSWMFDEADYDDIAGWDGTFLTIKYVRYMIMLWPKNKEHLLVETIKSAKSDIFNLVH